MHLTSMALRNIGRNTRRSVLSGIAIGVSALAIVFVFSLLNGMRDNLFNNVRDFVSGDVRIRHQDFETYEHLSPLHLAVEHAETLRGRIVNLPEVESAVARINFSGAIYKQSADEAETLPIHGVGIDFSQEERYMRIGTFLHTGRLPAPEKNEAFIGEGFASHHGFSLGDAITVLAPTRTRGSNAFTVKVVGIGALPFQAVNTRTLFIPLARARHFVRMGDAASEILIKGTPHTSARQVAAAVAPLAPPPLTANSWQEVGLAYSYIQVATVSYIIIALIFFLLASTVIINTTMMVIFERIREIGTLSAMGMNPRTLVRLFFLEALFIGALGALAGVVGGTILSAAFATSGIDFSASIQGVDIEFSNIIYPRPTALISLIVFGYSVAVSALTTVIPSTRSARIKPIEALHA